jgi:hypothetical protein
LTNKEYSARYYAKNREFVIALTARNRRLHAVWWDDYKSKLSCKECGENHPACLDFHHRDPSSKEFAVSVGYEKYGKKRLLNEIEKCDVLCANCHRKFHYVKPTIPELVVKKQ